MMIPFIQNRYHHPSDKQTVFRQSLGISELAVVKTLPSAMAREWPETPESAWEAIQRWGLVYLSVEMSSMQMEMLGDMSTIEMIPGWDRPAEIDRAVLDLDWDDVGAVWLIRKPTAESEQRAVWLFDAEGVAVVRFDVPDFADRSANAFEAMWDRAGSNQ